MKRYFMYSSGVASMALVLAVVVSFLAVNYTSGEATPGDDSPAAQEELKAPILLKYSQTSSRRVELDTITFVPTPTPLPSPTPTPVPVAPSRAAPRQPLPVPANLQINGVINNVNITFYDCLVGGFCGNMSNGEKVYEGAAACSWNLPIGTAFYIVGDPTGRIYVCKDRGLLTDTWVDIFWYDPKDGYVWQANVGRYGTIAIVSLP
jgi:hypothetical protein